MNQFQVKVADFEGPLDLLLSLIEKRKLHISEVSLSQVTDDYISHIHQFTDLPKSELANFIVVASTLILIKSFSLLPTLQLTEEEKGSIEDLEQRLKTYQRIKELSEHIKKRFGREIIFSRQPARHTIVVFAPTGEIKLDSLAQAMTAVLNNLPKKESLPKVLVKKVVSLEEVIGNLTKRIQTAMKMKFSDFVHEHRHERAGIIVSFLGMLELVKEGIIEVKQDELFQDIDIENRQIGTPRYGA